MTSKSQAPRRGPLDNFQSSEAPIVFDAFRFGFRNLFGACHLGFGAYDYFAFGGEIIICAR